MKQKTEWLDCDHYTVKDLVEWNDERIKEGGCDIYRIWPALVRNPAGPNTEFQQDRTIILLGETYRVTYWPSEIEKGRIRIINAPRKIKDS